MTTEIVRVDCESKAEIEEALRHLAASAGRMLHHTDNASWVGCHQRMNALLTDWENAPR